MARPRKHDRNDVALHPIAVRVTTPMKELLEKMAKDDRRSTSPYVRMLIETHPKVLTRLKKEGQAEQ